jgi:thiamine kinase-like enzyme
MLQLTGPFDSEEEFNLAIRKTYMNVEAREALISDRLDAMLGAHKHQIKFTHNDLHFSNIMVNNGHISSLIDWADSGWYPDYWEYVSAFRCYNQREDWNTILDNAIGRPHCEFLMIERIRQVVLM